VRFRKHFRVAPPDTWNESMVPLHEFLAMSEDEREGLFPFVWSVDRKKKLSRLLVASTIVASTEERRDFWTMLRAIAGVSTEEQPSRADIEAEVRRDVVGKIAGGLMKLALGEGGGVAAIADLAAPAAAPQGAAAPAVVGEYMAPWIDSAECTACDECMKINPNIFVYNDQKKAVIKDPEGGPYKDLVKAAERCTARVIHPGLPRDRSEKGIDKLIERAKKYN
jgi:pyruvate-ferredoxin/flavodoxin oxidoreductase